MVSSLTASLSASTAEFVAALAAVWACRRAQKGENARWALVGWTHLLAVWYLTLEVTAYYDAAHNGRVSGHEGLAVAGLWGLYGLALAVANRRWPHRNLRHGARLMLAAAQVYLLLGALLANARWALPGYRLFAYAAVLGATWVAEYLMDEDGDVTGILSLMAAFGSFGVGSFEVARWLEPAFTRPVGTTVTLQIIAWQNATTTFWQVAVWSLLALAITVAGARLRSSRTRLLGVAGFYWALLYTATFGVTNLAAAGWVQTIAFVAAVPGAVLGWQVCRRAPGERLRWEQLAAPYLPWAAGAVAAAWITFLTFR
jgi:hypothetical protein